MTENEKILEQKLDDLLITIANLDLDLDFRLLVKNFASQVKAIKTDLDQVLLYLFHHYPELYEMAILIQTAYLLIIQGEIGIKAVHLIADAKSIASQERLKQLMAAAFGFKNIGLLVDKENDTRSKPRQLVEMVAKIWIIHILPDLKPPAILTIVYEAKRIYGGFGIGHFKEALAPFNPKLVTTEFESDWVDPVSQILYELDVFSSNNLDKWLRGIHYKLHVELDDYRRCQVNFSAPNPSSASLEQAAFEVAKQIVSTSNEPSLRDYLEMWTGYAGLGPV